MVLIPLPGRSEMAERSIQEVSSDTEDVAYSIKRAKLSPPSPSPHCENVDSNQLYTNGSGAAAGCPTTELSPGRVRQNNGGPPCQPCNPNSMEASIETNNSMDATITTNNSMDDNTGPNNSMDIGDQNEYGESDSYDAVTPSDSLTPPHGLQPPPQSPTLPMVDPVTWVQKQIENGVHPMSVLVNILPSNVVLPDGLSNITLWGIVIEVLSDVPKRVKLPHINTLHDVVTLLKSCTNVIIVSGAGISVSCGIPDFRSKDGIYSRLAADYPDLPSPQAMFDIQYFSLNPRPFYKFAAEIWPGKYTPSPSHQFVKLLETRGSLLRHYTQNIDTLESVCGIKNLIECHGSFATATCRVCRHKVNSDEIKEDVMAQRIPMCTSSTFSCPNPTPESVMKPDIVFFGEGLPREFHTAIEQDRTRADLVIVMGSSLKVKPVAHIPNLVPPDIPQILINREPLPHLNFDVELLGDCDVIVSELSARLGWLLPGSLQPPTATPMSDSESSLGQCVRPARYIFPGAELCSFPEDTSQLDSCSEDEGESPETQSGVTTEDEDGHSDHYVNQMRYAMGCTNTHSENPGPSGLNLMTRPGAAGVGSPYSEPHSSHSPLPGTLSGGNMTPGNGTPSSSTSAKLRLLPDNDVWDAESVGDISVAAQMGDSREPSVGSVSVCSLEDMEAFQTT